MSNGSTGSEPREGTYLYAILRNAPLPNLADVAGVDGRPVRLILEGELAAVVSNVPFPDFEEGALREKLEDLRWLESVARAHHSVVDAVARETTTAPVSVVTVYNDDHRVRRLLADRREEILAALDRVAGRREWGVKVYLDQQSSAHAEPAAPAAPAEGSGKSGTDYLRRRRDALHGREKETQRAVGIAEDVGSCMAQHAVASRLYQPQDPRLSGRTERMVLNAAYLVADDRAAEFQAVARSLDVPGATIEVTGPWAPYSFVSLKLEQS